MIAYLLRHGRAGDVGAHGARTDEERTLTAAGAAELETSLRAAAPSMLPLQRIAHSPYVRARQSAEILAAVLNFDGALEVTPDLVPGSEPRALLPLLQQAMLLRTTAFALVGHEPTLGRLCGLLLTGDSDAAVRLQVGMLAAIELDGSTSLVGRLLFARAP